MKKEAANASKIRFPDRRGRRNGLATEIRERNGGTGLPLTHSLVSSSAGRDVNIRSQPILGRNCYKHAISGVRGGEGRLRGMRFYLCLSLAVEWNGQETWKGICVFGFYGWEGKERKHAHFERLVTVTIDTQLQLIRRRRRRRWKRKKQTQRECENT
jgi:hypothetical protein